MLNTNFINKKLYYLENHVVEEVISYFKKEIPLSLESITLDLEPLVFTYNVDIKKHIVHFIFTLQFDVEEKFVDLDLNVIGFPTNVIINKGKSSSEEMVLFLNQIKRIETEVRKLLCKLHKVNKVF